MYKIKNKILLSLHCNVSNGFLFVNSTTMSQFKAKNSEKKNKKHIRCVWDIFRNVLQSIT